jgi:hypothetical protein
MFVGQVIPLLIGVVAGLLLSGSPGASRARRPTLDGRPYLQAQVLLWLLLIAVLSAGVLSPTWSLRLEDKKRG